MSGPTPREHGSAARLLRAFSLRRNLRLLLVPPEGHLRPLDGLRALSILWVVLFHTAWYSGLFIPLPTYAAMVASPGMIPIWRGDFGVDIFFVLSGFLIAGMLIDEREGTGRIRLGLFYVRRLMRLWPALGVAVAVEVPLIDYNSSMVWANLLYVSNFIPIAQAAMGWTWSLAIEEQFYLVCPWLVRALAPLQAPARIAAIAGIAALLCGVGAWVVVSGHFQAIDSEAVVNRDFIRWTVGHDHLYTKPWMRAGPLLMGVAAAYAFRARAVMDALSRSRVLSVLGLAIALVIATASTHWPLVAGAPRAVEVGYIAMFRTVFGAAIAYVLLLSVSQQPAGLALGRVLSSRLLYPLGQLAYCGYLLNPIVVTLIHKALAPRLWPGTAAPMLLFLPFDMVGTFLAAAALHLFVERPFMVLRPKSGGSNSRARPVDDELRLDSSPSAPA